MDKVHIHLEEGQKLFFSSDYHFGHRNIIDFGARPVQDIKHMREVLIGNWNKVVSPGDIVVDLGDLCWFDSNTEIKKIWNLLNGTIYQHMGNHDTKKGFRDTPPHVRIMDDIVHYWVYFPGDTSAYEVVASHLPLMTWPGRTRGKSMNLFGHIHTTPHYPKKTIDSDLPLWKNQYDVGVDNNNLTPIEFREVLVKLGIE